MRKEFCVKDNIRISYLDENVCFEDTKTADSILISNDGAILHNNFDEEKTRQYVEIFTKIYPYVMLMRSYDSLESA